MTEAELTKLKFPVGEFQKPEQISDKHLDSWIKDIQSFPASVGGLLDGLTLEGLSWKYRPGGWSIKQVVHHCSDSHINSLMRFKLALTEEVPTIRPYYEDRWAELVDGVDDDLEDTMLLLWGLHGKWVKLLKSLTPDDLKREFIHPDSGRHISVAENIGIYAWHCRHHLAHVQQAIAAAGKYE